MNSPKSVAIIRHAVSEYNFLQQIKLKDGDYQDFLKAYDSDPESERTRALALEMYKKYPVPTNDAQTRLYSDDWRDIVETGANLCQVLELPEIIYVSPFVRTRATLTGLAVGWPELASVECRLEERLIERDHGLLKLYYDYHVFNVLYPEQRRFYELDGFYRYRYPQGENIPDLRARVRDWYQQMVCEFAGKKVMIVSHFLTILALRANLENWDEKAFMKVEHGDKPHNLGLTVYEATNKYDQDSQLTLKYYNKIFHQI